MVFNSTLNRGFLAFVLACPGLYLSPLSLPTLVLLSLSPQEVLWHRQAQEQRQVLGHLHNLLVSLGGGNPNPDPGPAPSILADGTKVHSSSGDPQGPSCFSALPPPVVSPHVCSTVLLPTLHPLSAGGALSPPVGIGSPVAIVPRLLPPQRSV